MTPTHLLLYVLLPALGLAALTALIRCLDLDLRINRLFFDADTKQFLASSETGPWMLLYHYGPIPGLILGIGAAAMFVASFVCAHCKPYRKQCELVALLFLIGPGLIINGILKPSWDRPRPCDLTEFGGSNSFVPVLKFGDSGEQIDKSFPSGHASMGFYLLAPIFVLSRSHRRWSIAFLVLGLSLGFAIGLGRVAQGRHFASDILWSGAIVYFTGLLLVYGLRSADNLLSALISQGQVSREEPLILHLEDYRETQDRKSGALKVLVQDDSKRQAA